MYLKTAGVLGIETILSTLLFSAAVDAAIPPSERDALIALYVSTDGDNWTNNTNWRKSPDVFNDAGTECTWLGVTCDSGETTVSGIALFMKQLTGSVLPELLQLTNLFEEIGLSLSANHLSTDSNSLREFLNSREYEGDWESSQTLDRTFAHFADGGGLFSLVVLFNLNDVAAATGQIRILGDSVDGFSEETVVGAQDLSVPATGLLSLRTDGVGDVQTGSVRVNTNRHVEGEVIFGGGTGLAGVGSSPEFPASLPPCR